MRNCKRCGTQYSWWNAYGDGLCKSCHTNDIEARANEEKEAKKKVQEALKSYVKDDIDYILKALTTDPPISYTFVLWNLRKKGNILKKVPGIVTGVALGGPIGEMVFGGSLLSNKCTYSAEIGLLVITTNEISIGHFEVPLPSNVAKFNLDHLKLFRSQIDSNSLSRKVFSTSQTQVLTSSIARHYIKLECGFESLDFSVCQLFIEDSLIKLASKDEIREQISQLGKKEGSLSTFGYFCLNCDYSAIKDDFNQETILCPICGDRLEKGKIN